MRKWYTYIFISGMTLCMTGCSAFSGLTSRQETTQQVSASDMDEQKATAQAYLDAMQKGDLNTALSYCTDDFQDGFKVKDLNDELNAIIQKYHLTSYSSQADEIVQEATQKVFKRYALQTSDREVKAEVTAIHVDVVERKIKSLITDYLSAHAGDVVGILASGGSTEKIQELAPDTIQYVSKHAQSELRQLKYEDMTVAFTFKKEKGTWKIAKTAIEDQ